MNLNNRKMEWKDTLQSSLKIASEYVFTKTVEAECETLKDLR